MKKFEGKDFVTRETETRKLGYAQEFKDWIKQNPGIIKRFLKALNSGEISKAFSANKPFQIGDITITSAELYFRIRGSRIKLKLGDKTFFIKIEKKISKHSKYQHGYEEFLSTQKAIELLEEIPNVEVCDFQLGYQDDKFSIFVSSWIDFLRLDVYIDQLKIKAAKSEPGAEEELKTLITTLKKICQILEPSVLEKNRKTERYIDVREGNMFYDPQTKKIILFDLSEEHYWI